MNLFIKRIIVVALVVLVSNNAKAQELNCQVTVSSTQVQGTDMKRIFDNMQKSVFEFMNNTKWTKDIYTLNEKIDVTIFINITEKIDQTNFKGTIQVQSRRPIFKANIGSPIFNYNDQNFQFNYIEFQQLDFNTNTYTSSLTSTLAYYAYLVIGLDYDTFSPNGGTEYFQKAQTIVANAQNSNDPGWKSFESNKNRYWIVDNLLNPVFAPLRDLNYNYHLKGLDIMVDKTEEGRAKIFEGLLKLKDLHKSRPSSFNMQLFFNAKSDEIVNIFSKATMAEKEQLVETLGTIDPTNTVKYQKILEAK